MISHHNVISQIMQMQSWTRKPSPRVLLGVLPLFHSKFSSTVIRYNLTKSLVTGLVQILQLPIVLDQQVIIMPKFDMKAMMEIIVRYKCDELWLVPRK